MFGRWWHFASWKPILCVSVIFSFVFYGYADQSFEYAQNNDRYLIDMLVERGILSEQEALQIRKSMASAPEVVFTSQKKLSIYSYTQIRYSSASQSYSESGVDGRSFSSNGASLRRQILAFDAAITDGTRAFISINTAASNLFDSLFVQRKVETRYFDYDLTFGYMSPSFSMESPAGAKLKTPDRSILNTFWGGKDLSLSDERSANQCFAGSHVGVFVDARAPFDEHVFWGLAVTNAKNSYWRELDEKIGLPIGRASATQSKTAIWIFLAASTRATAKT